MYGTLNTAIKIGTYHATHTNDANCKTIVASGVYNAIIKFSDDTILDPMKALSFYFFIRFYLLFCPTCIVALQPQFGPSEQILAILFQVCYTLL